MKQFLSILLFFCLAFTIQLQAQTLSIQGVIKNSDGTAAPNGDYEITFNLYNMATGDTSIWNQTISDIEVKGGTYSALIGGSAAPLPIFNGASDYFLGISIEGGQELQPRSQLTSAPYALAAGALDGTENTFPGAGSVGVGTTSPDAKLHVLANGGSVLVESASSTASVELKNNHGNWRLQGPHSGGRLELETNDGAQFIFYTDGGMIATGGVIASSFEAGSITAKKSNTNTADINLENNNGNWRLQGPHVGGRLELETGDGAQFIFYTDGGMIAEGNITGGGLVRAQHSDNTTASLEMDNNLGTWTFQGPHNRANRPLELDWNGAKKFEFFNNGDFCLLGNTFTCSDRRLKKNIQRISNPLSKINQLNGYTYSWIDPSKSQQPQIGVIAQELQVVYPELVIEKSDGMLSVNYEGLVPVLIEATKEQQSQIENLQNQVDLLAAQNEKMDSQFGLLLWVLGGLAGLLLLLILGYVVKRSGVLARGSSRGWQTAVGS